MTRPQGPEDKMYEFLTVLMSTYGIVFLGELGDKTQIAAGAGAMANRTRTWWIFAGSATALTCVALLTTVGAGLIPSTWLPTIEVVGGVGLVAYGLWLTYKALKGDDDDDDGELDSTGWELFMVQFSVVFMAELGDKTQIFTLGAAIQNQAQLTAVFLGSAAALVSVTGITVWGVSFVPPRWIKAIQVLGALALVIYGVYMLL